MQNDDMPSFRASTLARCLALALCLAASAGATAASAGRAAERAALQGFTLSDAFLDKWVALQQDPSPAKCTLGRALMASAGSLDQSVARLEADPATRALLARHGLTAREAMLGSVTLTAAAMQDLRASHPQLGATGLPVSAANMAFYHQHKQALQQTMQRLGREQLAHDGGRPLCASQAGDADGEDTDG